MRPELRGFAAASEGAGLTDHSSGANPHAFSEGLLPMEERESALHNTESRVSDKHCVRLRMSHSLLSPESGPR